MTDSLDPIVLNFLYAAMGGLLTLIFMGLGWKLFNYRMSFDISEQLHKGNIAVGLMVVGIFIGVGVAMGLVIGLGLN